MEKTESQKVVLFPVIHPCPAVFMQRVFPTWQKTVAQIHNVFCDDDRISCIILFGSAVTIRCSQESDIDLMVRLVPESVSVPTKNDVSEILQTLCDWRADILWFDRISREDRIYQSILEGVQIV